jgi:hypothetical protein
MTPDQERHERDHPARILDALIALIEWAERPYQPVPSRKLSPPKPLSKPALPARRIKAA